MSSLVLLAAAPDAVAPISAAVLALLAFLVLIPVFVTDSPPAKKSKQPIVVADTDTPLEDQVGI